MRRDHTGGGVAGVNRFRWRASAVPAGYHRAAMRCSSSPPNASPGPRPAVSATSWTRWRGRSAGSRARSTARWRSSCRATASVSIPAAAAVDTLQVRVPDPTAPRAASATSRSGRSRRTATASGWWTTRPAFDRAGFYGDADGDFPDNARRFALLGRAALETRRAERRPVDLVAIHDWHACPVALLRDLVYADDPVVGARGDRPDDPQPRLSRVDAARPGRASSGWARPRRRSATGGGSTCCARGSGARRRSTP